MFKKKKKNKHEYLIFSCIVFCNEHNSSFIEVTESELNVETDDVFDGVLLPFIKGE